jgi:uncharacterized membrane protein YfcA
VRLLDYVLAAAVMAGGACVQGAVGFGSSLVAAPLLVLIDPVFVPGPIAVAGVSLNFLIIRRRDAAPDPGLSVAVAGLLPGTAAAALTLAVLPERGLSILFALLVLAAVVTSAIGLELARTRRTLGVAGVASGFMGTIAGISGPPIALVYQRLDGPTLRATLGRYFLIASVLSLAAVAIVGRFGIDELWASAALVPGTLAGFLASGRLARRLDRRAVRPTVLWLSGISAVAVLARELF